MTYSHTYNFICTNCKSLLNVEINKEIDYDPKCLKCGLKMKMRYSILDGDIWMSEDLHE